MHFEREETPSFNVKFSFQSNMSFLVAIFITSCALGWALRDHRRRQLDLATEEQEDRLYLGVLVILFCVCSMGAFYSFNRTIVDEGGRIHTANVLVAELLRTLHEFRSGVEAGNAWPPYTPALPIEMPIPNTSLLGARTSDQREPDAHYSYFSLFVLVSLLAYSVWYFFPRKGTTSNEFSENTSSSTS